MSRKDVYDIVVLGATGFTGQFVLEELLKERSIANAPPMRICAAGRNKDKLRSCVSSAGTVCGLAVNDVGIEVVDVTDKRSVEALAAKTKVLLSCVGPYRLYGMTVASACVAAGADFLDISGEPQYLEEVQASLNQTASEKNVHIVGSCGFDSVPADMGTLFLQDNFPGELCYVEMIAGHHSTDNSSAAIHATTLECAVLGYANKDKLRHNRAKILDRNTPMPKIKPPSRPLIWWSDYSHEWCVANIGSDRSVVNRTQHLLHQRLKRQPTNFAAYFGMHSLLAAFKSVMFGVVFLVMSSCNWSRNLLIKYPAIFSGGLFSWAGPSREVLQKQSFSMTLVGVGFKSSESEERPRKPDTVKICKVTGPDPGYYGTARIVVQCAITMLQEKELLPKGGGVFTPGSAFMYTSLIRRLQQRGISFTIANA